MTSAAARTITLDIPEALYERVQHAATTLQRRVEEVLLDMVATALPPLSDLSRDVANDIATLAFLNDSALFQVARSNLSPEKHAQITALLEQKGRGELSASEQARLDDLVSASEVLVLRRAQAAALLQRRGYDMSDPSVLYRLP